MTNFAIPFSCVALLGAAVFYSSTFNRQASAPKPPKKATKVNAKTYMGSSAARIWVLTDVDSSRYCLLYKTRSLEPGKTELDIDPACDNVFDGSGFASLWKDEGNGKMSIANQDGDPIVKFEFDEKHGLKSTGDHAGNFLLVPST